MLRLCIEYTFFKKIRGSRVSKSFSFWRGSANIVLRSYLIATCSRPSIRSPLRLEKCDLGSAKGDLGDAYFWKYASQPVNENSSEH